MIALTIFDFIIVVWLNAQVDKLRKYLIANPKFVEQHALREPDVALLYPKTRDTAAIPTSVVEATYRGFGAEIPGWGSTVGQPQQIDLTPLITNQFLFEKDK